MTTTTTETYVVDAYHLLDFITKNKVKDIFQIEMYVRNHMYMGSYIINKQDFPERNTNHYHDQIIASKYEINGGMNNGNKNTCSEI